MENVERHELVWALVDAVHSMLEHNREACLPDFGTFAVAYEKSRIEHTSDGNTVIVPPKRSISFTLAPEDAAVDG